MNFIPPWCRILVKSVLSPLQLKLETLSSSCSGEKGKQTGDDALCKLVHIKSKLMYKCDFSVEQKFECL